MPLVDWPGQGSRERASRRLVPVRQSFLSVLQQNGGERQKIQAKRSDVLKGMHVYCLFVTFWIHTEAANQRPEATRQESTPAQLDTHLRFVSCCSFLLLLLLSLSHFLSVLCFFYSLNFVPSFFCSHIFVSLVLPLYFVGPSLSCPCTPDKGNFVNERKR